MMAIQCRWRGARGGYARDTTAAAAETARRRRDPARPGEAISKDYLIKGAALGRSHTPRAIGLANYFIPVPLRI